MLKSLGVQRVKTTRAYNITGNIKDSINTTKRAKTECFNPIDLYKRMYGWNTMENKYFAKL